MNLLAARTVFDRQRHHCIASLQRVLIPLDFFVRICKPLGRRIDMVAGKVAFEEADLSSRESFRQELLSRGLGVRRLVHVARRPPDRLLFDWQLVDFGSDDEIVLREPINRMRPQLDGDLVVTDYVQIGMMAFVFGDF